MNDEVGQFLKMSIEKKGTCIEAERLKMEC